MLTFLLPLHLFSAAVLTVAIILVLIAGMKRSRVDTFLRTMRYSFAATCISGVGLVLTSFTLITHVCSMMLAVSLTLLAVDYYYKKRLSLATYSSHDTKNTL